MSDAGSFVHTHADIYFTAAAAAYKVLPKESRARIERRANAIRAQDMNQPRSPEWVESCAAVEADPLARAFDNINSMGNAVKFRLYADGKKEVTL